MWDQGYCDWNSNYQKQSLKSDNPVLFTLVSLPWEGKSKSCFKFRRTALTLHTLSRFLSTLTSFLIDDVHFQEYHPRMLELFRTWCAAVATILHRQGLENHGCLYQLCWWIILRLFETQGFTMTLTNKNT